MKHRRISPNSLSGRFAALTLLFVVIAELLILLPSTANYRVDYLQSKLEKAQIASLSLLATDESISPALERELLQNAGVYNVVLRRDDVRQLVLSSPIPGPVAATYDLRNDSLVTVIRDALHQMFDRRNRVIRVIGEPVNQAGQLIEVTLDTGPLRNGMLEFGLRLLTVSAMFALITAVVLNIAAQRLIVKPIRRVVGHMASYAEAPEDARMIITPSARLREARAAEAALASMQRSLTQALKQKERLAQLGQAVARISHDLRNILTTSQIFADRLEDSDDPAVRRAAPKLVNSITRAVTLCETALAFGKAEEPQPTLSLFNLHLLIEEVAEAEALAAEGHEIEFLTDVPSSLTVRADRDQLYRVLSNLTRNARQAIEATSRPGTVEIAAREDEREWTILVGDTGPGLPGKARENLFQPFSAGSRKGGTGLGLAIAADLVRAHGGRLELTRSDETGTQFVLHLPRTTLAENLAAE